MGRATVRVFVFLLAVALPPLIAFAVAEVAAEALEAHHHRDVDVAVAQRSPRYGTAPATRPPRASTSGSKEGWR